MAVSEQQKAYSKKYISEKLDEIRIRPAKGSKERWKAEAEKRNKSLNQFVIELVETEISKGI